MKSGVINRWDKVVYSLPLKVADYVLFVSDAEYKKMLKATGKKTIRRFRGFKVIRMMAIKYHR